MNRIDRLHALLTHLQSKKRVTAKELADRFGLSLRTVYRDVKALGESGVPIIGEAGIGYSVMEGYRLPPVLFTREEAGALLLSSKLAGRFTDDSVKRPLSSALYKIKAVLRGGDKDFLDHLDGAVEVASRSGKESGPASQLLTLQQALIEKRVVCMDYYSPYRESTSERVIEPVGLLYYSTGWHLIAWCRLRNDYHDFRVDRITRLRILDETYNSSGRLSLQEYICSMPTGDLVEVTVLFKKEVARMVVDQKYLHGFISEEMVGECVRMKFATAHLDFLARWLLMFTDSVTIEGPGVMLAKMRERVAELQHHYAG